MKIAFTYFAEGVRCSRRGTVHNADPRAIFERLSRPRVTADKYDVPALSFATFSGSRCLDNILRSTMISIDIDGVRDLDEVFAAFGKLLSIVYTTYSSTAEAQRARAFVVPSRPMMTLGEHRAVAGFFMGRLKEAGHEVDRDACRDASRAWPLPAIPHGGQFAFRIGRGDPLDVDGLLSTLPIETPPPPPRPVTIATNEPRLIDRARAYLAKCEPAIAGSGGHATTFNVAQKLVRGFGLDEGTAWALMVEEYNPRCQPQWLPRELAHKVKQAARNGRFPEGALRDAQRRTA